jgi:hypothetical protein
VYPGISAGVVYWHNIYNIRHNPIYMKFICSISFCLLLVFHALAQDDKINSDQPDQSTGASIVAQKNLQWESSFYVNRFTGEGTAVISSNMVRYGISKKLEARLHVEQGYHRDLYLKEAAHGNAPLAIGAKYAMVEEKKIMPAISLAGWIQLPVTNFNDEPSLWSPTVLLIAEKKLHDVTLTVNTGIKEAVFEHEWEYQSTADVKYELNEAVSVFTEYFAQFASHEEPLHNLDGGVLFSPGKKVQFHLSAGTSIFHQPSNYFVTMGFAFMFGL